MKLWSAAATDNVNTYHTNQLFVMLQHYTVSTRAHVCQHGMVRSSTGNSVPVATPVLTPRPREFVVVPIKRVSLAVQYLSRFLAWNELLLRPLIPVVVTEDTCYQGQLAVYFAADDEHVDSLCDYPSLTSNVRVALETDIRSNVIAPLTTSTDHTKNTRNILSAIETLLVRSSMSHDTAASRIDTLMRGVEDGIRFHLEELSKKHKWSVFHVSNPQVAHSTIYKHPLDVLIQWRVHGMTEELHRIHRQQLREALANEWTSLSVVKKHATSTRPNDKRATPKLSRPPGNGYFNAKQNPFAWSTHGSHVSIW